MDRREAIQRTAIILGYAISAPALNGVLIGCKADPRLEFKPNFFNNEQAAAVSEISEIIIPKTNTPGAIDAGVPGFIDSLIGEVYTKDERDTFLKGLNDFNSDARSNYGDDFFRCSLEQRIELFKRHHDKAIATSAGGGPTGWWNAGSAVEKPWILIMKELTLLGFFTSEVGATQVLQYNQVPGPYQGCVPLTQVGKAWAT